MVMLASSLLHIPIWWIGLEIADIKKSGGRVRDAIKEKFLKNKKKELEESIDETFIGGSELEDEDVKIEREKVAKISESDGQPIVVVKVGLKINLKDKELISRVKN